MRLSELGKKKLKPLRDLIAFIWTPEKVRKTGIHIPDSFYNSAYRLGRYSIGKVIAVGPEAGFLKKGDKILIHEYGMIGEKSFKEDLIYFIEEENIPAKITGKGSLVFRIEPKDIDQEASNA